MFRFWLATANGPLALLNYNRLASGHVSEISFNAALIAQATCIGDIQHVEYVCVRKKTLCAPPSLFAIAKGELVLHLLKVED